MFVRRDKVAILQFVPWRCQTMAKLLRTNKGQNRSFDSLVFDCICCVTIVEEYFWLQEWSMATDYFVFRISNLHTVVCNLATFPIYFYLKAWKAWMERASWYLPTEEGKKYLSLCLKNSCWQIYFWCWIFCKAFLYPSFILRIHSHRSEVLQMKALVTQLFLQLYLVNIEQRMRFYHSPNSLLWFREVHFFIYCYFWWSIKAYSVGEEGSKWRKAINRFSGWIDQNE